jgi:hypothetical protein
MVVSARRLLQCFNLPDKNSRCISRCTYNFLRYCKMLCIYSSIFRRTPDGVVWNLKALRNPTWDTTISRLRIQGNLSMSDVNRNVDLTWPLWKCSRSSSRALFPVSELNALMWNEPCANFWSWDCCAIICLSETSWYYVTNNMQPSVQCNAICQCSDCCDRVCYRVRMQVGLLLQKGAGKEWLSTGCSSTGC